MPERGHLAALLMRATANLRRHDSRRERPKTPGRPNAAVYKP